MMSVSSTCRNTPSSSPKSPPNRLLLVHLQSFYLYPPSPNVELADIKEFKEQLKLQGVFINREPEHKGEFWNLLCFDKDLDRLIGVAGDWREEWRSRPNSIPPRAWIAQVNQHFFLLHRSTIIWGGKIRSYVSTSGEQKNRRKGQVEKSTEESPIIWFLSRDEFDSSRFFR